MADNWKTMVIVLSAGWSSLILLIQDLLLYPFYLVGIHYSLYSRDRFSYKLLTNGISTTSFTLIMNSYSTSSYFSWYLIFNRLGSIIVTRIIPVISYNYLTPRRYCSNFIYMAVKDKINKSYDILYNVCFMSSYMLACLGILSFKSVAVVSL